MGQKHQVCVHGHDTSIVGRNTQGHCKECAKYRVDIYHKNNSEKEMKYRKTHKKQQRKRAEEWRQRNPEKVREASWRSYGIINKNKFPFVVTDYDKLYKIQNGKCAICGRHQSNFKNALSVDHDHKTGIVRGLLCVSCNRTLGFF